MKDLPALDRTPLIERLTRFAKDFPGDRAYTFMDYMTDPDGVATHVTWGELDRRARSIAAAIRRATEPGRRVALLAPQDLHYVTGFLGAMYARVIGVPLFSEHPAGKIRHQPDRLASAITAIAQGKLGAWRARVEVGGI